MDISEFRTLMHDYGRIVNSRSVEFYALGSWQNLNVEWKPFLSTTGIDDLISYVNSPHSNRKDAPDSLKKLKDKLGRLEYRRNCVQSPIELWEGWTDAQLSDGYLDCLQNKFRSITSSQRKKAYTNQKSGSNSIDSLVDIGSGVGHLSRMISLHNKLTVMAVEGNHQFTVAANCLDEKLLQDSAKLCTQKDINLDATPVRLTDFVTEDMAQKVDDFALNSAILVGLHCCGDFSSTILKVFVNSRKARALVLLGCCYHKEFQCFQFLNPDNKSILKSEDQANSTVFPLSRKWHGCELDYVSREAACHNNENMKKRFLADNTDISRYARAQLEKWIWSVSDSLEDRNIGMCSVKCIEQETTFEEYIRKAMAKRGSHLLEKVLKAVPESELSSLVSSFKSSQFDAFDVIRLMFAPAIESAIIDDRIAFLNENGIHAKCVPLFDPTISPRNLAIVAYKD